MLDPQNKKLQQLNTLVEMTALINSTLDPYTIKTKVIEAATRLLDTESGSLILIDPETQDLYFEVAVGEKSYEVQSNELPRSKLRGILLIKIKVL
ncbi:MAG TPA: hypothetical protein ENG95_07250 [Nitrospirae bacterium]|nr:hypothetical protein BMS3Abin10_02276 [bacterium BMS3Abin10]GBE38528.1 hypothetical protein BMS3Bbin08_01135 [bacterium BMS3Bbin08]HDH50165.1 hypothetical protein [Nitrospirota bacterium]HDK17150.1 hypothetical protein [Nitrospirota bacterium]HDO26422.1 hypothetical protein [Nitrospirota bacterium]